MTKSKNDFKCPECGSAVKAWADLDAQITFSVTSSGKLIKPVITNSQQSDGRCGVGCISCKWRLFHDDMQGFGEFEVLAESALAAQESIDFLTAKRIKNE